MRNGPTKAADPSGFYEFQLIIPSIQPIKFKIDIPLIYLFPVVDIVAGAKGFGRVKNKELIIPLVNGGDAQVKAEWEKLAPLIDAGFNLLNQFGGPIVAKLIPSIPKNRELVPLCEEILYKKANVVIPFPLPLPLGSTNPKAIVIIPIRFDFILRINIGKIVKK